MELDLLSFLLIIIALYSIILTYLYIKKAFTVNRILKNKDYAYVSAGFSISSTKDASPEKQLNLAVYHRLYKQSIYPILIIDATDGKILDVNNGTNTIFRKSDNNIIAQNYVELINKENPHFSFNELIMQLKNGKGHKVFITHHLDKHNTIYNVENTVFLLDFGHKPILINFIRDLSDINKMEHQLLQFENLRAMERLSAGIIHEINNPLGIIQGHLELLALDLQEDSHLVKEITAIRSEVNRIASILRKLLNVYKPEWSSFIAIDIKSIFQSDIINIALKQLTKKGHTVSVSLPDDIGLVFVPPEHIQQAFLNLIINAEDALKEKGILTISAEAKGSNVEIQVQDNGVGIESQNIKHLFDPFFTTKGTKGTGLGLSVTSGIIRSCGGSIRVSSEINKGTTFIIDLPLYNPANISH